MKAKPFSKVLGIILAVVMLMSILPMNMLAASVEYNAHDDYYKVITKTDYELAPGIVESEIVLNNAAGSHRQVAHVVEVDLSNPYAKVIPSYKGMVPTPGNYGVQIMSEQAKWAEDNGYGNVVAAMNLSLSWYDSAYYDAHPELKGEPLGYMVLDGEVYMNSNGQTSGAQTCVVINFDEKDGVARPADMPKVMIRSTADSITGWEEQVIPANFGFLVKDGVNQYKTDNNATNGASRSFVGIKADGTFVMVMNDGRQSPYSAGFTNYEMAEFMLSLGCVQAVNGDGGGSSAFLSQRPGEELKVNCSPSDGAERPTTHGILVISTAPATGEFVRANITSENDYYTPGSTVEFSALGTDLVGTPAEIPADVTWQLADSSMGTIENGIFVSNGKVGTATAQMIWNGEVVGSASVEIIIPTEFTFTQSIMTVPFNKEVNVGLKATINGGLVEVVLKPSDVVLTTTNDTLGTFDGFMFTSVSEENAPADLTSTLTATLVHDTALVATASLSLGRGSDVLFDFEEASDISAWNIADVNGNDEGFYQNLSYATAENGEVHDGVGSMRVEMNPIAGSGISNGGYAQSDLFLNNGVVVKNAKSIGFWAYIPDEYEHCWIRVLYWYDSNNDGKYDKKNTVTVINQPEVYNTFDESGWRYFSVDVSAYSEVLIPGIDCKDLIAYNASKNDANNFRFIEFMFPHTNTNDLWKTYGTINGLQTVYVDNITADFSDAVDDREAPVFSKVELAGNDTGIALTKYTTVTTASNLITVTATVAENTSKTNATGLNATSAKAYVDGVEVPATFANGRITISDVSVADGVHRIKFEICDNMGNKAVVIRLIKVASGVDASTVQLVPADSTLNNLYGGSIYWMNMNANKIETIQSVKAVIDLNYGNHFELDNMILADGFTSEYSIDEENNTATIVITRTEKTSQTGEATLAALPVRVIYYDTDISVPGYTAETYWNTYGFWPYDVKVDVDMGEITYVDGYTSDVIGAFSNEEFSVDTELQAAFSDPAFKAERGTAHVHTPVAVDDKAASCTEVGYTGRTYCEVCDSVVDWGTTIPTTGHTFKVSGNKLVCDCGTESDVSGLVTIDGVNYYAVAGTLTSGWIGIGDDWYYFDNTTFAGVDGNQVADNGISFVFDNGRVTKGVWVRNSTGLRYWYGPGYYKSTFLLDSNSCEPYEIDGNTYLFSMQGYMQTGIVFYIKTYNGGVSSEIYYYDCGEDGIAKLLTGPYKEYFYQEGVRLKAYQLVECNGDFYFINDGHKIAKSTTLYLSEKFVSGKTFPDGRPIPEGKYYFDEEGKMEIPELKNGVIEDKLYINGVLQKAYQLVAFDGDFYFINDGQHRVAKNTWLYLSEKFVSGKTFPDGRPVQVGKYYFDAEGKMEIPELKNGVIEDKLYINDVLQKAYQLVEFDGDLYFINDGQHRVAKNTWLYLCEKFVSGKTFPDGRPVQVGKYYFDAEGKMEIPELKNGVIEDKLYINGVLQKAYQLVEFDGDFYFINDGQHRVAKNTWLYLSEKFVSGKTFPDGRPVQVGKYYFDAEGKMEIPELKNGVIEDKLYINDVLQKAYQLVEFNGDFYFINDGHKVAKNTKLYLSSRFVEGKTFSDGSAIAVGYYEFDADGKMILN